MSLICNGQNCCLLDHRLYISKLFMEAQDDAFCVESYEINKKLFCIKTIPPGEISRKRKYDHDVKSETLCVEGSFSKFMKQLSTDYLDELRKLHVAETKEVRELSQKLFESILLDHSGLSGGNNSDIPMKCKIKNDYFLIPQKSRFYCGDVKEQCGKLNGNQFDILIADPPWWNKYIRRLKSANDKLSYSMMYNEDIAAIPVKNLLASNCLVAVWCTNAPSNIEAVKNTIFPQWGVEFVTTWYWLKVTIDMKPLCPFGTGCKKQPYERIIIGKVGDVKEIPEDKLIISVPSALHSHKPPLLDLLKPYLEKVNPETLELFARYLLPHTTSVGYEPLKWQHISLYEEANKDHIT